MTMTYPMRFDRWFRFRDDRLNNHLLRLLHQAGISYGVDKDRNVYYLSQDEEPFEDLLSAVRDEAIPSWQILSSPEEWVPKYRAEIVRRKVPFYEEMNNGQIEFLLPRAAKPHSWRMA